MFLHCIFIINVAFASHMSICTARLVARGNCFIKTIQFMQKTKVERSKLVNGQFRWLIFRHSSDGNFSTSPSRFYEGISLESSATLKCQSNK